MEITGKRGKISRRVRLEDIARRCNVSVSTVSRALSSGAGVKTGLRTRIIETARTFNYAMPSSVAGKKAVLVASTAAMVDYARNQFTLHVLQGLQERAMALRMEIVTRPVSSPEEERVLLAEALCDPDVAGLLFMTLDDEEMLVPARDFGKTVVLVNGDDPDMRLSSVAPCNRAAAALATNHLRRLGHERILFLMRPGRRTIERRLEGWRNAMGAAKEQRDLIVEVEDWLPELAARAVAQRIEQKGLDFTAILAAGDSLAFGAMMALAGRGIRVPDEVSVMGMDGLPQGALLNPPLTAVQIPMRAIGSVALDLLREAVTGLEMPARRVELACCIVERGSTAQKRQGRP